MNETDALKHILDFNAEIDRQAEAFWLRDKPIVDGSPTVKQVYMLAVRRGVQIQRNVELDQKVESVLAKIANVSERGATAL